MEIITILIYLSIYIGLVATTFYILSFFSDRKEKKLFSDEELPKVSIMIPVYNEEKSIENTLKSVLASDYPREKFEVIIIDDGSKDNTLKIAKKFESRIVRVFSKKQGGKGSALNFGLKKASGEIVFSMDADTFVNFDTVRKMARYFKDKDVMCVTPGMVIHKPRNWLQKIQSAEYLMGLFLRKTFSSLNAMHITPGAFSAYRKSFFDKYGGYDEGNITEDLEIALRIQYHGYRIENSSDAPAYTIAPSSFTHLLKQRRRWYSGLMKNMWKYREIFSSKYGDLGLFVLPVAWISIFLCVVLTTYFFFTTILRIKDELIFLNSINYDFGSRININFYFLERLFYQLFTNPVFIFLAIFIIVIGFYLYYASKKIGKQSGIVLSLILFFIFFAVLFGFWWIISALYVITGRKISWK